LPAEVAMQWEQERRRKYAELLRTLGLDGRREDNSTSRGK
jgi:hypothetical protein